MRFKMIFVAKTARVSLEGRGKMSTTRSNQKLKRVTEESGCEHSLSGPGQSNGSSGTKENASGNAAKKLTVGGSKKSR